MAMGKRKLGRQPAIALSEIELGMPSLDQLAVERVLRFAEHLLMNTARLCHA
jgi:hypothetical protein